MPSRSKSAEGTENAVRGPRERTFLVARRDSFVPLADPGADLDGVLDRLSADPTVTVERVLTAEASAVATSAALRKVLVVRMPEDTARELAMNPQLLVEEDAPLHPVPAPLPVQIAPPVGFLPFGPETTWRLRVLGEADAPVPGATVVLYGGGVPAQGRTDESGQVSLRLTNESDATVRALYVSPRADHWDVWVDAPRISSAGVNVVRLEPLAAPVGLPGVPTGWGHRAMRLDRLDPALTGAGVTVAVIDSGAASAHPDLEQVKRGRDFTVDPPRERGWDDDALAHGSHCSAVIAGQGDPAGIRGFAPAADVLELRVFPGGRFSSLLAALDFCITEQVDVVNLSLGSVGPARELAGGAATSELVLAKLAQARMCGVACVVAAGNTGGPVQFPGTSPDVLTVAAVGRIGEFPVASLHARHVPAVLPVLNGWFSPAFTSHGPEVDVCAPGVAVVSAVPPDGFAAWDGTSAAAPHVTGLAALVLAHHPDFADGYRARDAARVDRLFDILRRSATPLNFGDPGRSGAGVPDAVRAPSQPPVGRPVAPQTGTTWAVIEQLRRDYIAAGLLAASP